MACVSLFSCLQLSLLHNSRLCFTSNSLDPPFPTACPPFSLLSSSVASSLHPSCPPIPVLLLHHIPPLSFIFYIPSHFFYTPFSTSIPVRILKTTSPYVVIVPSRLVSFWSSVHPSLHTCTVPPSTSPCLLPTSYHLFLSPSLCPSSLPPIHSHCVSSVQVRWRSWSPCG